MILKDKIFLSDGLGWTVEQSRSREDSNWIAWAVCPKPECRIKLDFEGGKTSSICIKCKQEYSITKEYQMLRGEVDQKYQGSRFWMADAINLDLLPTKLAAGDEDENYWIQVRLGQNEGKRTAVIYIGEKLKEQKPKDKIQLFVDLDDEQIRFDKGNKHPANLLSKVEVTFPNNKVTIQSKNK